MMITFAYLPLKSITNHSKRNAAILIAVQYGYVPKNEREF